MAPSFLDRFDTTQIAEDNLRSVLLRSGISTLNFGQNLLLEKDNIQRAHLKRLLVKNYRFDKYASAFLMKFSPDLILFSKEKSISPFFVDVKASRTPVIFEKKVGEVQASAQSLQIPTPQRHEIGIIEREAYDVYSKFFPDGKIAVCYSAPYTPNLILIEWVNRLKMMFRYQPDRNEESGGSGTPHVNIHLGLMRPLDQFFREEFNIELEPVSLLVAKQKVQNWPLDKPAGNVTWAQFKECLGRYSTACEWLKGKFPDDTGGVLDYKQAVNAGIGKRKKQ